MALVNKNVGPKGSRGWITLNNETQAGAQTIFNSQTYNGIGLIFVPEQITKIINMNTTAQTIAGYTVATGQFELYDTPLTVDGITNFSVPANCIVTYVGVWT